LFICVRMPGSFAVVLFFPRFWLSDCLTVWHRSPFYNCTMT
jgi:hypothetical protein